MSAEPDSNRTEAEAEGSSLGEARWNAALELEAEFPGLTADCVRFETLSGGDGAGAARVRATVDVEAWRRLGREDPDDPVGRVRAFVGRVVLGLGLSARVEVEETEEEIRATVKGDDLGLLIGRHGATIDAIQHLAARVAHRATQERKRVVVDAAGYRERRQAVLHRQAERAVADALAFRRPVELEPMSAADRKIVHDYLSGRGEVTTHSEGEEPDRRLVVSPVRL